MEEIEVPRYFLCPISLEMMKDPVTISTGITYDRESIERWIFKENHNTCPVSKQTLISDSDVIIQLTPNITLRRLIQAWCTVHASQGIERFPTPKPPVSRAQISKLLDDATASPSHQDLNKCLEKLKSIAAESETNKRSMEAAGAAAFLASVVNNINQAELHEEYYCSEVSHPCDEALRILYNLRLSEDGLVSLLDRNNVFITSLVRVMQRGSYESRTYAVMLMRSILEAAESSDHHHSLVNGLGQELFVEIVQVLHDQISPGATKAALKLLIFVCHGGRNRIKAAEAGVVALLVDLLVNSTEKRACEMMMVALDMLCQCAEGRAALLKHGAGLAVVSKKIFRVSNLASERAVRVLYSVSKFSATSSVLQEMLQLGVVAKLCLVAQVDCGVRAKEKAREILKMHSKAWKNSPCLSVNYVS